MQYPNQKIENEYRRKGYRLIAGADEAGRGAWAGPIVAAAVILPANNSLPGLRDSKLLSPRHREQLCDEICGQALAYQICSISSAEIDRVGVGEANIRVIAHALELLPKLPHVALVDGTLKIALNIPVHSIIDGDAQIMSIAAASILAKVFRDRMMVHYDRRYPLYRFAQHKGYGTAWHQRALRQHGASPIHRRSYAPIRAIVQRG
ncbi:MAG: ribonuclease HII [Candidatus Kerfeldbacteria bacterium]|nr:ribonuclease HII [Candidatus Kerfeldbacteria bacterium]